MVLGSRKKENQELKKRIELLEAENQKLKSTLGGIDANDQREYSLSIMLKATDVGGIGFFIKSQSIGPLKISLKAREILGLGPDQPVTVKQIAESIQHEDRIHFEKAINQAENHEKHANLELKIIRADAEGREFRMVSMHIDFLRNYASDEKNTLICTMMDITGHDKIRRDLVKAREKAEEREKNKNMLLKYLSHEIRTPMNAIIGYSELLKIGDLSYDKRREYVSIIKEQGVYLHRLVDDMAEFARMETGKIQISKSPCNIELLLNEIVTISNQHKIISNKPHLDIRVHYPKDKALITYTDPGRLQQLLINLVRNAINYTSKGYIEIGYQYGTENRIEFYIKDTSTGLSRDQQKKSFTDELTFLGKYEGAGFELTISKNLIKLLGGRIWTETIPGEGSTYHFSIPKEDVPATYHEALPEEEFRIPPYSWKDKVVLIVEDDDVNFKFLETVLHDTDVQILRAVSGFQAVELCQSSIKIDIILMDIKLPELNGLEASRRIREFNQDIPIVAQSAFILEGEKDIYLQAGINDHIDKPINIKEFFEKMDGFLKES